MSEVARQETDSISVTMEIEGEVLKIEAVVLDREVFPEIDWGNKKIRALMVDLAAHQVKNLLTQRFTPQENRQVKVISATCDGCGYVFPVEVPCTGCKDSIRTICPKCKKPLVLQWKRSQQESSK